MNDIAEKTEYFPTTHEELVSLIEKSIDQDEPLSSTFGVRGGQLIWRKGTPMPWYVRELGLMRGVLNENMEGAGI
jgi:hypothetical protein